MDSLLVWIVIGYTTILQNLKYEKREIAFLLMILIFRLHLLIDGAMAYLQSKCLLNQFGNFLEEKEIEYGVGFTFSLHFIKDDK